MKIVFQDHLPSDSNQVLALYEGVGWSAYTKEPERLLKGLAQSQVITAYVGESSIDTAKGSDYGQHRKNASFL